MTDLAGPEHQPGRGPGAPGAGGWREETGSGPLVLKSASSPLKRLLALSGFAAAWNAGIGLVFYMVWTDFLAGKGDGCMVLFLVPFVLIGLFMLYAVPSHVRQLFDPRPVLVLDHRLELGTETRVHWSFRRWGRPRRMKLILEGLEVATQGHGTTAVTEVEVFFQEVLVETEAEAERSAGMAIPAETMHSFQAPRNRIDWQLRLHATVDGRPNVDEAFPLTVHPPGSTA